MATYDSVLRDGVLDGLVVLVTGGGTGIGRCIAHEAAHLGAEVVVAGRRDEPLRATCDEIAGAGGRAVWHTCDVRDAEQVERLVETVVADHGGLHALVNNAGGQFPSPAEEISPNGWRSVIDLNLNGTFLVTRQAFRSWMGDHGGSVVSIVADMWNGFPYMSHTGAARAGVVNLTRTLAVEWGHRGVRVNAVAPGLVYSSGMDTYPEQVREAAAQHGRLIPAGRIGTESEVSAAVCFLLSPAARFVTGETIRIDGGASLASQPTAPLGVGRATERFDGFHLAREIPEQWLGEDA